MKAIDTGMGVAYVRATGMLYPKEKRLYEDPYSEKLLSPFYKFFIFLQRSPKINDAIVKSKEKSSPGIMGWMFCRFRYIDDVLKDSIAKKEIETVVNLGVGMDYRAYYIPGIESIRYFELDHPSVIKQKKAKEVQNEK
jgi:methyltransferase (TIGR00027 family)